MYPTFYAAIAALCLSQAIGNAECQASACLAPAPPPPIPTNRQFTQPTACEDVQPAACAAVEVNARPTVRSRLLIRLQTRRMRLRARLAPTGCD